MLRLVSSGGLHRCGRVAVVSGAGSINPLVQPSRSYRYSIPEGFVPSGAATSAFASSSVPSERRKVLQEYSVCPLFGTRYAALLIGSKRVPSHFIATKAQIPSLLEDILDLQPGTVTLGPITWLSNSVIPRNNTDHYRRVDRRTGEVVANCLVPVYLPSEVGVLEAVEAGMQLADKIIGADPCEALRSVCGVTYCEFEVPDLQQHYMERLMGEAVDPDAALDAIERWMDRIAEQQQFFQGDAAAEASQL